jgi:quinol monooxygenase YgiN
MARMTIQRRAFLAASAAAALAAATTTFAQPGAKMYGLIGKMIAAPGRRDELIAILLESVTNMPGCLSYIVAKDADDANGIWITEAWESKASHDASLSLPAVKAAIAKGRPLVAGFGDRIVTTPIGGHNLVAPRGR